MRLIDADELRQRFDGHLGTDWTNEEILAEIDNRRGYGWSNSREIWTVEEFEHNYNGKERRSDGHFLRVCGIYTTETKAHEAALMLTQRAERHKAYERRSYCVECYRTDKTDMKDVEPAQMTLADWIGGQR